MMLLWWALAGGSIGFAIGALVTSRFAAAAIRRNYPAFPTHCLKCGKRIPLIYNL
jgi:hypothetical protein